MEELCLKWDEHHPAVISVFEELLVKGALVDCTIAAEGQYLKAHKVVLAACSPYFELLFSQEHEKNPIVILKDMKFQELKYLIDFAYRGQVKLQKDQLDAFVAAGESLQIKGLSSQLGKTISEKDANKTIGSRGGCISPVPCKRRRHSQTEPNEDNWSDSSPGNDSRNESNVRENLMPAAGSSGVSNTSAVNSLRGTSLQTANTQQGQGLAGTEFPLQDQPSASPEQVLPDVQTVVKTEPEEHTEPLTDVILPEPKNEEYVDNLAMLESDDVPDGMQGGTSQQNANDYPGFSSYDSTGDAFLTNQMTNQNATSGTGLTSDAPPAGISPDQMASSRPYMLRSATAAAAAAAAAAATATTAIATATATATSAAAASAATTSVAASAAIDPSSARKAHEMTGGCLDHLPTAATSQINQLQPQMPSHVTQYQQQLQQIHSSMVQQTSSSLTIQSLQTQFLQGQPVQRDGPALAGQRSQIPPQLPEHTCTECNRVFHTSEDAEAHIEIHSMDQPYKCQHCRRTFKEMGHLQIHQRLHRRERPFRCDSCDSSFTQRHSLISHKRIHSVDYRYQCSACLKTFGRSGDLLIHRRLVCMSRVALG